MAKTVLMTQRAMSVCKRKGWLAAKTEQWIAIPNHPAGGGRRDLFGWMDLIVLMPINLTVGVQACPMSTRARHIDKLRSDKEIISRISEWCIRPKNRAELWAFRKQKVKRGGVAVRWTYEVTDLCEIV